MSKRSSFCLFLPRRIHEKDIGMNVVYVLCEKLCKSSLSLISSFFSYNHKSFYCDTSTNVVILYSPHMSVGNSYTNIKAKLFLLLPTQNERFFKVICAYFILQTFCYKKLQTKKNNDHSFYCTPSLPNSHQIA